MDSWFALSSTERRAYEQAIFALFYGRLKGNRAAILALIAWAAHDPRRPACAPALLWRMREEVAL